MCLFAPDIFLELLKNWREPEDPTTCWLGWRGEKGFKWLKLTQGWSWCVWLRGREGINSAQIFRNTFPFSGKANPVHRCQSGRVPFEAAHRKRKSDVSASVQNPHHLSRACEPRPGNSSFDKLGEGFWPTYREHTSACVRGRRRAELDDRGQVNKGLRTVCYSVPLLS